MNAKPTHFEVVVQSKNGMLSQSAVEAITSLNEQGVFDVLPNHANLISIIKDYVILHFAQNESKEYKFTQGIMEVHSNKVSIFLDVFSPNIVGR